MANIGYYKTMTITKRKGTAFGAQLKISGHLAVIASLPSSSKAKSCGFKVGDTIVSMTDLETRDDISLLENFEQNFQEKKKIEVVFIRRCQGNGAQQKSPAPKKPATEESEQKNRDPAKTCSNLFPESSETDSDNTSTSVRTSPTSLKKLKSLKRLFEFKSKTVKRKKEKEEQKRDRDSRRYQEKSEEEKSYYRKQQTEQRRKRKEEADPASTEAYKERERQQKRQQYHEMDDESKRGLLDKKSEQYEQMTPGTKKEYKTREGERSKKSYEEMTPETKEAYKRTKGDEMKQRYEKMTPETKEAYKRTMGDEMKQRYEKMTPETKETYKTRESDQMKQRYDEFTPDTKTEYIGKQQERVDEQRAKATPRTKETRRADRRERESKKRDAMSPNSREQYNQAQTERVNQSRKEREKQKINLEGTEGYDEQQMAFEVRNQVFQDVIMQGCPFICISCYTTRYRHQVIKYHPEKYRKYQISKKVFRWTEELPISPDTYRYICTGCRDKVIKNKCPARAVANNMGLTPIPAELNALGPLELRLISLRFLFYKIVQRGVGARMPKIKGAVVNVPVNMQEDVISSLPRNFGNSGILAIALKRRLQYKSTVLYHTVRIQKLFGALECLKEINPHYAEVVIEDVNEFLNECQEEDPDLYKQFFTDDQNSNAENLQETVDSDDESESSDDGEPMKNEFTGKNDDMVRRDELFQDTVVLEKNGPQQAVDHDENIINSMKKEKEEAKLRGIEIAPAEGKKPLSIFQDKEFEILAHPNLFPDGKFGFDMPRDEKIYLGQYVEARLFSSSTRFTTSPDYIFAMNYRMEYERLWGAFSIQMRQSKSRNREGGILSAGNLRSSEDFDALLKKDCGFKFLRNIRGSPPYWKDVMNQVLAMIKNFGKPTWFFTLSCYDTGWDDMLMPIYERIYGQKCTKEKLEELTWAERCNMLRKDPVTVCRQFQCRLNEFFKQILLNPEVAPLGKIKEYFWRIEFQARGSPHMHCLLWVENAPEINKNTPQEITDFIEKYITCEIPSEEKDKDLYEKVNKLQLHKHRKTCQKKGELCRFHFPKDFCPNTTIHGLEQFDKEQRGENSSESSDSLGETESEKKPQAFKTATKLTVELRRMPEENFINAYNALVLRSWGANMDCQYITNYYAVVVYVLSYICKAEAEMSSLMRSATQSLPDKCSAREYLKTAAHSFLTGREVGLVESVYRSCSSLRLRYQTRRVQYVPTGFPEDRVRLIKDRNLLAQLEDDDTDIYFQNLLDRYGGRLLAVTAVKNMCLAQFAAYYQPMSKRKKALIDIELEKEFEDIDYAGDVQDDKELQSKRKVHEQKLQDDHEILAHLPKVLSAGGAKYEKRTKRCAINYHQFNVNTEPEKYYYSKVLLFMPWTDEEEDLANCREDPKAFFDNNFDLFRENMRLFEPDNIADIEEAVEYFANNEECLEEELNKMYPEGMAGFAERKPTGGSDDEIDDQYAVPEFGAHNVPKATDIIDEINPEKPKSEFVKTELLTEKAYAGMVDQVESNSEQGDIFHQVEAWCKATVESRRSPSAQKPPQLLLFISGPGGTGKSFLLKVIRQLFQRTFAQNYGHESKPGDQYLEAREPEELVVIVGAYTGKAARNVNGQTLHSALGLTVQKGSSETKHMTAERLQYYKNIYSNVEALMIDEVSMLSIHQLYEIHERLQTFRSEYVATSTLLFGGLAIIAFGDFHQLPPIGEPYVFMDPTRSDVQLKALSGHLWRENFVAKELVTIVRQKNDKVFAEMLNRIRVEKHTKEDVKILRSRVFPQYQCPTDCPWIFAVNHLVINHNEKCLKTLVQSGPELMIIMAEDRFTNAELARQKKRDGTEKADLSKLTVTKCDNGRDTGGLITSLSLCIGARVMLLKNIKVTDGLCNGTMGTVRAVTKRRKGDNMPLCVWVEFDKEGEVVPGKEWKREWMLNNATLLNHLKQTMNYNGDEIGSDWVPIAPSTQDFCSPISKRVSITRIQIPLILCYACTFHKVQGQTLNKIVVSFAGKPANKHTAGAAYVALSRVTTLEGLFLIDEFDPAVIRHSIDVDLEMQRQQYGLSHQDLRATRGARAKEQKEARKEEAANSDKATESGKIPQSLLKAIECACSRPNSFCVKDFNTCIQSIRPIGYSSNRQAKDKPLQLDGYKVIYTQQNGNALFCALSILLVGNMKHERLFRALAVAAWVRISRALRQQEQDLPQLHDINDFKLMFVRGNEPDIVGLYCLCCALGCSVTLLQVTSEPKQHIEPMDVNPEDVFPTKEHLPFLGYLMHSNSYWWAVAKLSPDGQSYRHMSKWKLSKTKLQLQQIIGHSWKFSERKWTDFADAKLFVPKTRGKVNIKVETGTDPSKKKDGGIAGEAVKDEQKKSDVETKKVIKFIKAVSAGMTGKKSTVKKQIQKYYREPVTVFASHLPRYKERKSACVAWNDADFEALSEMYQEARTAYTVELVQLRPFLTPDSFLRHMQPNGWLADQSMDRFMDFLKRRQIHHSTNKPRCYYVDTYFWTKLELLMELVEGTDEFEETKKETMLFLHRDQHDNILTADLVILPLNLPGHWILVVVNHRNKLATVIDSLGGRDFATAHTVVETHLRFALNIADDVQRNPDFQLPAYDIHVEQDAPQQNNGYDCGVFTLLFMALTAADHPISSDIVRMMSMENWRQLLGFCAFCGTERYELLDFID